MALQSGPPWQRLPRRRDLRLALIDPIAVGNVVAIRPHANRARHAARFRHHTDHIRGQPVGERAGAEREPSPVHAARAHAHMIAPRLDLHGAEELVVVDRRFDARIPGETGRVIRAGEEMLRMCVEVGGTISGEHGIGFEKNNYMPWIYSEADLDAMRRVKEVFDPTQTMNPWKFFPTPVSCAEVLVSSSPHG